MSCFNDVQILSTNRAERDDDREGTRRTTRQRERERLVTSVAYLRPPGSEKSTILGTIISESANEQLKHERTSADQKRCCRQTDLDLHSNAFSSRTNSEIDLMECDSVTHRWRRNVFKFNGTLHRGSEQV